MELNFDIYVESNISLWKYILLQLVLEEKYKTIETIANKKVGNDVIWSIFKELEVENYVKIVGDTYKDIVIRSTGINEVLPKNIVCFDEFWNIYPTKTPKGRPLRAKNKMWDGKLCRDYLVCQKKYYSKVKTKKEHEQIIKIIKARAESGDYEYMNNMETYINQCKWEQDIKYLDDTTVSTINKMI